MLESVFSISEIELRDSLSVSFSFKLVGFDTSVYALNKFGIPLETEAGSVGLSSPFLFSFDI